MDYSENENFIKTKDNEFADTVLKTSVNKKRLQLNLQLQRDYDLEDDNINKKLIESMESCSFDRTSTIKKTNDINNLTNINHLNDSKQFKTKRFYETSDDNTLMTKIFSQTIRSTNQTPTEDNDLNDIIDLIDIENKKIINNINNYDINDKSSRSLTPNLQQQNDYNQFNDNDNYSNTEFSNAESHTENIDNYNEPNLSSLIDNIQNDVYDECIDEKTDPDINLWDNKNKINDNDDIKLNKNNNTNILIHHPSIVVEFYNDDLIKTEEYKLDNNDFNNDINIKSKICNNISTPIIQSPALSYFDTTIEEEEEEEIETYITEYNNNINNSLIQNGQQYKDINNIDDNNMTDIYTNNIENDCNTMISFEEDDNQDNDILSMHESQTKIERLENETSSRMSTKTINTTKKITSTISTIEISNVDINQTQQTQNDIEKNEKSATKKKSDTTTGKKKSKKSKKSDPEKENISVKTKSLEDIQRLYKERYLKTGVSVKAMRERYYGLTSLESPINEASPRLIVKKSSFSKFDALQKKIILHVRSSDADKAQNKFNETGLEIEKNCRACNKVVYKMEEVKAEKNIWHRNCFRCIKCAKQLNVDTYQSNESLLYCKPHFRLLFAPKAVEDNEPVKPKKPELIIRENQPVELPPDVVRASDKPDLGLEELQQLNVKSRFQVFENYNEQNVTQIENIERSLNGVKRSPSILSKLAKFQAKGMNVGITDDSLSGLNIEHSSSDEDIDPDNENSDIDLIRTKRAEMERPIPFGNMNDIKTKFENGHAMTKEERREERKQEIQNIRSRLFMGKQAKIKEMYQQAVAESEHGIISSTKKPEIDIKDKARSLKEKFEKGEILNRDENDDSSANLKIQEEDMAVFEQGISKKSRSIFMELDASAAKSPQGLTPTVSRTMETKKFSQSISADNVIKCDEKLDDIKIETSEISSKFNFFEKYTPTKTEKKEFRMTPPRDGVIKPQSQDNNLFNDSETIKLNEKIDDPIVAEQSQTATKMLSVFRQMEEDKKSQQNIGLKPLKRFTPPLDENRRLYDCESDDNNSGEEEEDEEDDGEEEDEENYNLKNGKYADARSCDQFEDEFLKQAQSAARAKQLRAKFEKWEANEIRREMNNSSVNLYESLETNEDSQIESTKTLRAKFESMRDSNHSPSRPRIQVNRFI